MDKYHFNQPLNRKHTRCYKYDSADAQGTRIGLWVADMDLRVAPAITRAIKKRAEHDVFGYVTVGKDYRQAVHDWYLSRHGWNINTEYIQTVPGVVPAITAILRERVEEGKKKVMLHTPAYNCFFSSIDHAGAEMVASPLILENQHYRIHMEDMRAKIAQTDTLLLCNPHNPTGRVWTREELTEVASLCAAHHVLVIADEIHCEFGFYRAYTPFGIVAEELKANGQALDYIVLNSASKAWNIAGLRTANAIAGDDARHQWLEHVIARNEMEDMNVFGIEATIAAYKKGGDWMDCVNTLFRTNYEMLCIWMSENAPLLKVTKMEGTYLAWVDCRAITSDTDRLVKTILQHTGVKINSGKIYGDAGFIRINLAISSDQLMHALMLIRRYLAA